MESMTLDKLCEAMPEWADPIRCALFAGGGSITNGKETLELCDYRSLPDYANVVACKHSMGGQSVRFNITFD